jgi:hypothetical protein
MTAAAVPSAVDSPPTGPVMVYVSGRAGVAVVEHDGRLGVLSVESSEPVYPARANRAVWLAGTDDVEVQTADRLDWVPIRERLLLAWRVDRAVQLFLAALDDALTPELRVRAATLAERHLMNLGEVGQLISRRLFAAPLPEVADTNGLRRLLAEAKGSAGRGSAPLLQLVDTLEACRQGAQLVARAWDEARIETLEDPAWLAELRSALVDDGTFERLTRAVLHGRTPRPASGSADARRIRFVSAWAARIEDITRDAVAGSVRRVRALATLARRQHDTWANVLTAVEAIPVGRERAHRLCRLLPDLPDALLPRVRALAQAIIDQTGHAKLMSALADRERQNRAAELARRGKLA